MLLRQLNVVDDMFLAYGNTVYADTLTEIHQVRGGIESDLVAC